MTEFYIMCIIEGQPCYYDEEIEEFTTWHNTEDKTIYKSYRKAFDVIIANDLSYSDIIIKKKIYRYLVRNNDNDIVIFDKRPEWASKIGIGYYTHNKKNKNCIISESQYPSIKKGQLYKQRIKRGVFGKLKLIEEHK